MKNSINQSYLLNIAFENLDGNKNGYVAYVLIDTGNIINSNYKVIRVIYEDLVSTIIK